MIRYIEKMYERAFRHDDWNIGVVNAPIDTFLSTNEMRKVQWFPRDPNGRFFADPFGVMKDGTLYILCEEFDYAKPKGRIVSIKLKDGAFSPPELALELPTHISYPYLIQNQGEIYCVPETYEAHEVAMYKATEFPKRWEKVAVLVDDFDGVDSTVFQFEGRWWLTCTSEEASLEDLYAWHSRDLLGPWIPHTANPIKRDIVSARPAGTPFVYQSNLYRPAQDSSKTYGGRIVLNRILSLSPTEFSEEVASLIEPEADGPWPDGTHTLSAAGSITLVDGKRLRFIVNALRNDLYDHIRGISRRDIRTILPD